MCVHACICVCSHAHSSCLQAYAHTCLSCAHVPHVMDLKVARCHGLDAPHVMKDGPPGGTFRFASVSPTPTLLVSFLLGPVPMARRSLIPPPHHSLPHVGRGRPQVAPRSRALSEGVPHAGRGRPSGWHLPPTHGRGRAVCAAPYQLSQYPACGPLRAVCAAPHQLSHCRGRAHGEVLPCGRHFDKRPARHDALIEGPPP